MSDQETEIMRAAYRYLKAFSDVPRYDDPGCDEFWANAASILAEAGNKWRHHPLVEKVFLGIYEYLEIKMKELSK